MAPDTDVRPLLVNASDTGGSATATKRIYRAIRSIGLDSRMLVQEKSANDVTIIGPSSTPETAWSLARPHVDMLQLRLYGKKSGFVVNWLSERMSEQIGKYRINAGIVHDTTNV